MRHAEINGGPSPSQFTSGIGVDYKPSVLVSKPVSTDQDDLTPPTAEERAAAKAAQRTQSTLSAATKCKPGMRFPSAQVLAQFGARPWQLHHRMPSDGRFRVVVFGGDLGAAAGRERANAFASWLEERVLARAPRLALPPGADPHLAAPRLQRGGGDDAPGPAAVDVLLVHAGPRARLAEPLRDLHPVYHPFDARLGWDYDHIFADEPGYQDGTGGDAYEAYGVDRAAGAVVVVRPDGYVGIVTTLEEEDYREVGKWFEGVLRLE